MSALRQEADVKRFRRTQRCVSNHSSCCSLLGFFSAVRVANPKAGLAVGTTSPRGITAPMPKYGMPALGQKQTCAAQKVMSALPPKADICGATRDVRFVPKAVRSLPIRSGFAPSPLEFTVSAQARDAWDQISTVGSKIAWQLRRPEHRAPCFCNGDAPTQSVSCQFQYPDQAVLEQRPNL